jgi:hypothetical protein
MNFKKKEWPKVENNGVDRIYKIINKNRKLFYLWIYHPDTFVIS